MLVLLVLYIVLMPLFDDVVKGLLMWSPNLVEEKEVVKGPGKASDPHYSSSSTSAISLK